MLLLVLAFMIGVPILEIALFIEVGAVIGLWPTLVVVVFTAILGTLLLRRQGLSVLFRFRQSMEAGGLPLEQLFDGICLLLAGALLLTPGFFTDGIGFLLFVAPLRAALRRALGRRLAVRSGVIDGEFEVVHPAPPDDAGGPPSPPSPR
jgi:UPF0716 protein FxsA